MKLYGGIDPGAAGALCLLDSYGAVVRHEPFKGMSQLLDELRSVDVAHLYLEKAQPMRKAGAVQGVVSVFTYGEHFGYIQGLLLALGIPHTLVPPKTWQKTMFTGTDSDLQPKARALQAALRMRPDMSFLATPQSKVPHNGLVDAYLIARCCLRTEGASQCV